MPSAVIETPHTGLEALPDGVCLLDAAGRVTYANPAAERLLAVPRDVMVGRTLDASFPGVDAASLARGTQPNGAPLPPPWTARHGRSAHPTPRPRASGTCCCGFAMRSVPCPT